MGADRIGDLTRQQLACLRLVSTLYTDKAIAQHLKLSPKTVSHHIAAARATLGAADRYAAAAMLAEVEGPREKSSRYDSPMGERPPEPPTIEPDTNRADRVRDVAAQPFVFDPAAFPIRDAQSHEGVRRDALAPFKTVALIFVIAMSALAMIVAALPAAQTWSAIANLIEPHHH